MSDAPLLTAEAFRAMAATNGFSRTSKDARAYANDYLDRDLEKITKQTIIATAVDKRSGFAKPNALLAVERTANVPKGYY